MKNLIVSSLALLVIFTSCTGTKMATYNDDVYANPTEDRRQQEKIAAANKRAQEAYQKRSNDSIAAQQQRDNNNPYYKDPQYNADDYYDYEYATRVKRFQSPVNGLGYYDNYYTNTYFYSGNPYQYGMSVYNGYNFWPSYNSYNYFPSSYFYSNYGWNTNPGFSIGFGGGYGGYGGGYGYGGGGYGYGGYDPFLAGYYRGYNSGFWGYPYGGGGYGGFGNPYGYGGYGAGGYGGWGYYNGFDQNSGYTYAPRASHDGGNGSRPTNPNVSLTDPYYQNFVQKVVSAQANTPKFTDVPVAARSVQRSSAMQQNNNSMNPVYNNPANNNPSRNYTPPTREQNNHVNYNFPDNNNSNDQRPAYSQPNNGGYVKQQQNQGTFESPKTTNPTREYNHVQQPVQQQQPVRTYEPPAQNYSSPSNNFPRGGGGGGSQGGGGGRPR